MVAKYSHWRMEVFTVNQLLVKYLLLVTHTECLITFFLSARPLVLRSGAPCRLSACHGRGRVGSEAVYGVDGAPRNGPFPHVTPRRGEEDGRYSHAVVGRRIPTPPRPRRPRYRQCRCGSRRRRRSVVRFFLAVSLPPPEWGASRWGGEVGRSVLRLFLRLFLLLFLVARE